MVIPYFTQARMRPSCERGISRAGGGEMNERSSSVRRNEAGGETICRTRGFRAAGFAGTVSGSGGVPTDGFDLNSASAACRALMIRSWSSLPGYDCCSRLSKIPLSGDAGNEGGARNTVTQFLDRARGRPRPHTRGLRFHHDAKPSPFASSHTWI